MVGALAIAAVAVAATAPPRPTLQKRFAQKEKAPYIHLIGSMPLRNDFYNSLGIGTDVGYYPFESLGFELRWQYLNTSLNSTAEQVRATTGLVPDARPQDMLLMAGARYSFGYGKVLVFDSFVVHFDPQLTAHGGVAFAETRVLPTLMLGMSLLTHYAWGLQAKIDLCFSIQAEERNRGVISSLGFVPIIGIGWNPMALFGNEEEEP